MAKSKLVRSSLRILGGSSIAGFGLSFGRDIYKKTKKAYLLIFLILLIFSLFTSGVWTSRNYKSIFAIVGMRISAILIGIPSLICTSFIAYLFLVITKEDIPEDFSNYTYSEISYIFFPSLIIYLIGFLVGYFQRKKRKTIWDAELHNERFLIENNIIEHEDGTLEDALYNVVYSIKHVGAKRVTLMPFNRKGKRAYIDLDNKGFYINYTGLISI